jgi:uncharacterized damage-inducible protein DinB
MQEFLALTRQFILEIRTNGVVGLAAILLAGVSLVQAPGGPAAQLADLQKDWREQKNVLVQLAEAMPAEKFDYRPTPAQRTYGEQILHVAMGNVGSMRLLGTTRQPPFKLAREQEFKGATKQDIIRMLSDAYDFGAAVLAEQTPDTINAVIDSSASSFWGGSTRARIVWSLLSHGNDIYGQMVVYVRLNGIVPPASRGI